ncbi:phenoloxidase 1-like, partial [Diaphorina citri]|uniref:Phenoloxidase 1-like n=1 Tax=Diaphorina citri TaxID=121845 RepID=A0A1S3CZF2_DIACI
MDSSTKVNDLWLLSGFSAFLTRSANEDAAPVNASQMSNHMFSLYFDDKSSSGLQEQEDYLEYYRHDLGINLFHYHWHEANPFAGNLVGNHRRGESFYYMHQQMLAR